MKRRRNYLNRNNSQIKDYILKTLQIRCQKQSEAQIACEISKFLVDFLARFPAAAFRLPPAASNRNALPPPELRTPNREWSFGSETSSVKYT
jgi:hypothetical protein